MAIETWLAFALASAIVLAIPSPTILLVVGYALGGGRATGWATAPGVALGDFAAMTASLLGVGALLATSATAFTILKWAGAIYLIWLGIKMWRAPAEALEATQRTTRAGRVMFANAFVVTLLNPKSILFFIAFTPQFIDPAAPLWPQIAVLELTFITLATANAALWAIMAGSLRERFGAPGALRWANRVGGSVLIAAGAMTAALRRA